jgi:hypothetical protein
MPTPNLPFALPTISAALPVQGVRIVSATPAPPQTAAPVIATANEQIAQLATQLAGLELQRVNVLGDLRSSDAAVRSTAQGQLRALDAQIAQTRATLKDVSSALARQQQPVIIAPPSPDWYIHNGQTPLVQLAVIAVVAVIVWQILSGIGRRVFSRRGATQSPSTSPDTIAPRLDRMEQAIDAIAIEVERISESQRFIARILAEPGAAPALVGETAMAERHPARPSITPR